MTVMGIWGAGVFSDDVAEDVRDAYRQALGDGVPDDEATTQVLAELLQSPEDAPVVWLALAATQCTLGRLDQQVKAKALALIVDGTAVEPWLQAKPAELRARRASLERLRTKLLGPQPDRKPVRRVWRPDTDLLAGDLLARRCHDGSIRVLRVVAIETTRNGTWPVLELLEGQWPEIPPPEVLSATAAASTPGVSGSATTAGSPRRWTVSPNHRGEPSWGRTGFVRAGSIEPRTGDAIHRRAPDSTWPMLAEELDHPATDKALAEQQRLQEIYAHRLVEAGCPNQVAATLALDVRLVVRNEFFRLQDLGSTGTVMGQYTTDRGSEQALDLAEALILRNRAQDQPLWSPA
jgi:hypothetical protein